MAHAGLASSAESHVTRGLLLACLLAAFAAPAARAMALEEETPPAATTVAARPTAHETAQAREQARLCERQHGEDGVAACRAALALGIGPARRSALRQKLASRLVVLEKWDELVELCREDVRLEPTYAGAWERLGRALLFTLDRRADAVAALEQAVRLAPGDAEARVSLGLALAAGGRYPEAVAALHEALRLEPAVLAGRPAARAVLEAAEHGLPWP
jgi:tetratricopeptide (TPR) repeat protein